ncbi:hypothetical protein KC730_00185 [Candidatus Kaiserbacteria bacterium]|nr:hypothetical protein [Candidatus Kaiserbacteria bacterium]
MKTDTKKVRSIFTTATLALSLLNSGCVSFEHEKGRLPELGINNSFADKTRVKIKSNKAQIKFTWYGDWLGG